MGSYPDPDANWWRMTTFIRPVQLAGDADVRSGQPPDAQIDRYGTGGAGLVALS
jgi:hypothetical protein